MLYHRSPTTLAHFMPRLPMLDLLLPPNARSEAWRIRRCRERRRRWRRDSKQWITGTPSEPADLFHFLSFFSSRTGSDCAPGQGTGSHVADNPTGLEHRRIFRGAKNGVVYLKRSSNLRSLNHCLNQTIGLPSTTVLSFFISS